MSSQGFDDLPMQDGWYHGSPKRGNRDVVSLHRSKWAGLGLYYIVSEPSRPHFSHLYPYRLYFWFAGK